jgi:hypothetical protein
MPYQLKLNGVKPAALSGNDLAYNHAGLITRAFWGADLVSGARYLIAPKQNQAAGLVGVHPNYVCWAIKRLAERADIEAGRIPLIPPHAEHVVPKTNGTALTATSGIDDSSLVKLVRAVGIDRVLTAAVVVERALKDNAA